jgi:hypothetical protein
MKKLIAAAPVLTLVGALVISSCVGSGDSGTGTGLGGSSGGGVGGSTVTGQGGATTSLGGTNGSLGGATGAGGAVTSVGGAGGGGTADGGAGTGGGAGGMMGGTGGANLLDAAKVLNGLMLLGPCRNDTQASVCATVAGACPGANAADPALSGVLTTNKMLTMGGTMGQAYTVTLHVQGVVESKQYPGGVDQNTTALTPKADGFATGGTPTGANAYNVYMLRVTNPGGTAKTDYFFNSLQAPYVSNHTVYGIDYTAKVKMQGGASLRLVAADSNCSMIKNCGPLENDGNTCGTPIIPAGLEPASIAANPTFNFNTAYNGQWIVFTVTAVTSP